MLPPLDPTVLLNNPKFSHLHNYLTTSLLNPDGSSKTPSAGSTTSVPPEALQNLQIQLAKTRILKHTLPQIAHGVNNLPEELQEVIELVAARLKTPLSPEDQELLHDDVDYFLEHLTPIGKALSAHLSTTLTALANLAHAPGLPPRKHNPRSTELTEPITDPLPNPTHLADTLTTLRTTILSSHTTLSTARLALLSTTRSILSTHRDLLETLIRALEQTKYGSVQREMKARADLLVVVAGTWEAKLRIAKHEALAEIYSAEARAALVAYKAHLEGVERRLRAREKVAEGKLREYEGVKEGDMGEVAVRYRGLLKGVEDVRADIRRLGGEA